MPAKLDRDPAVVDIERAMVRVRRTITRGWFAREVRSALGPDVDFSVIAVLDAIEEGLPANEDAVTVGRVAERMGVDQSRASRVVASAVASGHVRRIESGTDGRQVALEITKPGAALLADVHRLRRSAAARLVADWPAKDRAQFARLFTAFVRAAEEQHR